MGTEQSASMMRIAVLAVIVAVAMSSMEQEVEVSELADAGHTAKAQLGEAKVTPAQLNTIAANNNNPDMAGTGRFKGTKTLNFPGTPYGKPGYKESHNWEQDTDWFSPLVFKWKYYAAQYGLKGKSEEAVKKDWMTNVINKKDAKYPDCRHDLRISLHRHTTVPMVICHKKQVGCVTRSCATFSHLASLMAPSSLMKTRRKNMPAP